MQVTRYKCHLSRCKSLYGCNLTKKYHKSLSLSSTRMSCLCQMGVNRRKELTLYTILFCSCLVPKFLAQTFDVSKRYFFKTENLANVFDVFQKKMFCNRKLNFMRFQIRGLLTFGHFPIFPNGL